MADPKIVSKVKTTCACGSGCVCGCGCGCGTSWRVICWIAGILVVLAIFCIGVKLGEFRVEFHDMMSSGYYRHPMMMQGGAGFVPPATGLPVTAATGSPANP